MKRAITISCCIMIALFCSSTYGAESIYGRLSLGLAMPGESDITDLLVPGTQVKTKYKTSMFSSLAAGKEYQYFRFEGELSFQNNELDNATMAGVGIAYWGEVSAITFLINGYFDYKNHTNFTPYITAGYGASMMKMENFSIPTAGFGPLTDYDYVMAYQMGLGVGYKMDKRITLDLNYRYFVPSDPDFQTTQTELASHNVSLGLRISF